MRQRISLEGDFLDLWKGIWVATNPDVKANRRRKDVIVCEHSRLNRLGLLCLINILLAPLNVFASSLKIPVHVVPPKEVGLKSWEVFIEYIIYIMRYVTVLSAGSWAIL